MGGLIDERVHRYLDVKIKSLSYNNSVLTSLSPKIALGRTIVGFKLIRIEALTHCLITTYYQWTKSSFQLNTDNGQLECKSAN